MSAHDNYSDSSIRRLGYTITLLGALLSTVAFLEVIRQYSSGGQERVVRAYYKWRKLSSRVYDRPLGHPRRWTIEIERGLEKRLVQNYDELEIPERVSKKEQLESIAMELKPDKAFLEYYKQRGSV